MQILKAEVQAAITDAALQEFALRGYAAASMARIAKAAGISVGNVYRYFPDKRALFDAVLPSGLVKECREKLRLRVRAAWGKPAPMTDPEYAQAVREVNTWAVRHRLQLLILLKNAAGSPYEGFSNEIVDYLAKLAADYGRSIGKRNLGRAHLHILPVLYRSYLSAFTQLLASIDDADEFGHALQFLQAYHLGGLGAFFQSA